MLALKAKDDFERLCLFVKSLPSMRYPEVVQALQRFRSKQESFIAALPPDEDPEYWIEEQIYCAEGKAEEYREQVASGKYSPAVQREAFVLATEAGIDPQSYEGSLLREGVARVLAERAEAEADTLLYPLGSTDEHFNMLMKPTPMAVKATPASNLQSSSSKPAITVSQLVEEFLAYKASETTAQTLSEYKRFLELVQLLWGPTRLCTDLNASDLKDLSDRLKKMRKHLKANTPVAQWDTDDPKKLIAQKTRRKYFELVKSLLKKAKQWGRVPVNFWADVECPKVKSSKPEEKRQPFSKEQLLALFSSPLYTGCLAQKAHEPGQRSVAGPHKIRDGFYWIPIIASVTGMREDEIIQLRRCDIRTYEGIWCFDVNGEDGKSIKNKASWRQVPIHARVIELGFLEYVETVCKHLKMPIFADVHQATKGSPKGYYSQWFTRYRNYIGFPKKSVVFHSFRHTVADLLRDLSAPDYVVMRVLGHAPVEKQPNDYGNGPAIKIRAEWVNKIDLFWLANL